ncbi:MAG: TMEM165/GDT1 family protein, partial [Hadesarchaea archaeon]|nr:TMEM165/GDT1 family protein [Hadesarchaea archaeon]
MDLAPLISSFGIVALAEFGDKTQLATITLAARCKPLPVFFGAMLAVLLVDGLSVAVGGALAEALPRKWVGVGSGLVFIFFGIHTLLSRDGGELEIVGHKSALATSFSLIALMELGDKTQFASIALAAKYGSPALVIVGIALAYLLAMGTGVLLGTGLLKLVPARYLRMCSSAIFILFGIAFLFSAVAGT